MHLIDLNMNELQTFLLNAAIRAPSGDNCQPWKFRFVESDKLAVYLVPSLATSFFDVEFRATYISLGAVIENVRVAAATRNFETIVEYHVYSDEQTPLVVIALKKAAAPAVSDLQKDFHAMMERTVNRRPFLPKNLSVEMWQQLLDVNPPENISVITYIGKQKGEWAKAVRAADLIRWSHPEVHHELFQKIRYTMEEAQTKGDGLEIDRLGAGPAAKYLMKFLSSWRRQSVLNKLGGARGLAEQTVSLLHASSGLIGVWGKTDDAKTWVQAGEVTQKLWIQAHKLGLAVQPLPVAILLKKRFEVGGNESFLQEHKSHLLKLSQIIERFATSNIINPEPIMMFRVGKAIPMKSVAVRKSIECFIK